MKKVLVVVCAVAFCLGAASADAQVPYVQPYFDELQTVTILDECPTDPAGRLYIVAHNWGIFMSAIEYRIEYAPEITFLGDFIDEANILSIGSSPTGIALAWKNSPGVAFTSLRLQEVSVFYTCTACEVTNITVTVKKHPDSDPTQPDYLVRALDFNQNEYWGIGMVAVICPTVPVEETTWGGIKAQYK
jgi:hypothetical protein